MIIVGAPEKTMFPLVTGGKPVIPAVGVAVKVIVSAAEYTGVEIVTLFKPLEIVPVSVPLNVPLPVALVSVIVVSLVTFAGVLAESCDCTVTLNAVPAVPVLGTVV
jgi:hypothetical protein